MMLGWLRRKAGDAGTREVVATSGVADWLQEGYRHQRAGNHAQAERMYHRVLEVTPDDPDANYLLGRLYGRSGRYQAAEQLLERALHSRPEFAAARRDLGNIHKLRGRLDKAVACYRQALRLEPDDAAAHFNLGLTLVELGHHKDAVASLDQVVRLQPGHTGAREKLAQLHMERHDHAAALEQLNELVKADSSRPAAYYALGCVYQRLARHSEAVDAFRMATRLDPQHAEAVHALGVLMFEQKQLDQAVQLFEQSIRLRPDFAAAHYHLGMAIFEAVMGLDESQPELSGCLLGSEHELEALARAAGHVKRAIELKSDYPDALNGLGVIHRRQGEYLAAQSVLERAVQLAPTHTRALCNLGTVYADRGDVDAAIAAFEGALRLQPDDVDTRWTLANLRLGVGDFESGWQDYEARWQKATAVQRPFTYPQWDGTSLSGRTILVYGEQGLGDEIMFASCLPDVIARAQHCVVECDERLAPLFQRSFPQATVHGGTRSDGVEWLADTTRVDVQTPIGSLPGFFRKRLSDFPMHGGYLRADPDALAHWRERLEALGPGLKVGISWRGGLARTRRGLRSTALSQWAPLLRTTGADFISLQYTECADELVALEQEHGVHVHRWEAALTDYDQTAALVSALDLVVSVCTSVVSLSGALGRPVWVLVPSSPGWMFMRDGEQMPWFPSLRLFRQAEANEWGPVLARLQAELGTLARDESARAVEA